MLQRWKKARVVSYPPPHHLLYPSGTHGSATHIARVAFAVVAVLHSQEKSLLMSAWSFEPTIRGGGRRRSARTRRGGGIKDEACLRCGTPECSFDPGMPSSSVVHECCPHFPSFTTNPRKTERRKDSHRRMNGSRRVRLRPLDSFRTTMPETAEQATPSEQGSRSGRIQYKIKGRARSEMRRTFLRKVASST